MAEREQLAGRQPVAIGLRNWGGPALGHWSAVRGFDGDRPALANPAGNGRRVRAPDAHARRLRRARPRQHGDDPDRGATRSLNPSQSPTLTAPPWPPNCGRSWRCTSSTMPRSGQSLSRCLRCWGERRPKARTAPYFSATLTVIKGGDGNRGAGAGWQCVRVLVLFGSLGLAGWAINGLLSINTRTAGAGALADRAARRRAAGRGRARGRAAESG